MFEIDDETKDRWVQRGRPKATAAEIAALEDYVGEALPPAYREFIETYGYVAMTPRQKDRFQASFDEGGQTVVRTGALGAIRAIDKVIQSHRIATSDAPDDNLPIIPQGYLPIGLDGGSGMILMELGEHAGRIWHWPEREEVWGSPSNSSLGFVANDMHDFMNGLKHRSEP